MNTKWSLFGLMSIFSLAAVAIPTPVGTSIKEVGEGLQLPTEIKVSNDSLCWTGSGIRKKKVVVAKFSVYRLDSYLECSAVPKDGDLKPAIALAARQWALKLTFLRDVDSEKVRSSFKEALEANQIDLSNTSPVSQMLEKIKTDLKEGNVVWLAGKKDTKEEVLEIVLPTETLRTSSASIASDFSKIWFGSTKESTMEDLQAAILSRRYVD